MKYDVSKHKAPEMPKLGKGTECVKLLLSQASKDMHEPLVPMFFPVLAAHVSGSEFQYPDLTWKEMCGMMANLVGDSGCNKGQFPNIVEAINRDFRQHDETGLYTKTDRYLTIGQLNDLTIEQFLDTLAPRRDFSRGGTI